MASEATERLLVRIDATTEQLRRELKRADDVVGSSSDKIARNLAKVQAKILDVSKEAAKWGAGMAAAGAAATAALVKTGLQSVDALAKTADKLGVTTEALAQLRFAAEQTGIETSKFDTALQRFTRRLGDAASGAGPAVKAFEALGLSAQELVKLSPDEAFKRVADAMQGVGTQTEKVSIAFKLFDSEGVGLVNTLALGSEGLQEMAMQADAAGLSISRVDAAKIEAANDAINRASKVFEGFAAQLAAKFAPIIEDIAAKMFKISTGAFDVSKASTEAFKIIIRGAGFVGDAIRGIEIAIKGIEVGLRAFYQAQLTLLNNFVQGATQILNYLPWVDIKYSNSALDKYTDEMSKDLMKAAKDLRALFNERLPSQKVEKYIRDLSSSVEELGEVQAVAADRAEAFYDAIAEGERGTEQLQEVVVTATRINHDYGDSLKTITTNTESATVAQGPFQAALQGTVERIDAAFAQAWKGAFDSFKSFSDNIKEAFKNLLAELAHMAITRPIIMSIGAAFGLGGASGAMASGGGILSGISGAGGIMPYLTGGVSSALGGLGGAYTSVGNFFGAGSTIGNAALAKGRLYEFGSVGQGLGSLGLNLGAGFLGNYLGSQVFGGTSGIGSAVGGFAGSIFGPLGTGIGSFLGSGIEKGLGNLLGFGSGGNNSAIGDFNFGTGSLVSAGVGKNFSEKNLQAVQQIEQVLAQFANAIGGSEASFRVRVGNKSGFKLDGQKFKEAEDLIAEGFKRIAEAATDLSPALKKLISDFEGTADETAQFAAGIVNISRLMERNPIEDAVKDFKAQLELAGMSTRQIYDQQIMAIERMIEAFDGSLESTNALNTAMTANKQLAYDLAMSLQAVNQQINANLQSNINYFKQQTQTPTERIGELEKVFTFFFEGLKQATDPAQIQLLQEALSGVSRELFNLAPPELQRANVDFFIDRERAIAQTAKEQLLEAGFSLAATQENLNMQVGTMLDGVSGKFQESANTLESAAQIFMQAVQFFTGNATGQYEEITA